MNRIYPNRGRVLELEVPKNRGKSHVRIHRVIKHDDYFMPKPKSPMPNMPQPKEEEKIVFKDE
jgi:hypothetical protein